MKEGDFVELNYTGKTSEGHIFDTTDDKVAKENGLNPQATYKPITICLGQSQILPGLDKALIGKDIGKHSVELEAVDAFGKKNAKLIQLVPLSKFKKDNVNPFPGMQVNIDNQMAIIKRVSGGRVLVDFNHPLAGIDVAYDIEVLREVTDTKEKVEAHLHNSFGNIKFDLKDNNLTLHVQSPVPEEVEKIFIEGLKKVIPELKEVKFEIEKPKEEAKK